MFAEDFSDKESDYEDRSSNNSPNVMKKSMSTVGIRNESDMRRGVMKPVPLRATHSFTGALEELRGSVQKVTIGAGGGFGGARCPCGCLLRAPAPVAFRTRDRHSLALHVVPPEVLLHHGHQHPPAHIAMFWKKDCRMFLWKGEARQRRPAPDQYRRCALTPNPTPAPTAPLQLTPT